MAGLTGTVTLYVDSVDQAHQADVLFLDGTNNTVSDTLQTANNPNFSVGNHSLIAVYSGPPGTFQGSAPFTITQAQQQGVQVAVSVSPQSQVQGQPLSITVTLTPQ